MRWARDHTAIAQTERRDGLYALVTNISPHQCSSDRLLAPYKDRAPGFSPKDDQPNQLAKTSLEPSPTLAKAAAGRIFGQGDVWTADGTLVAAYHEDSMARNADAPLDPRRSMYV